MDTKTFQELQDYAAAMLGQPEVNEQPPVDRVEEGDLVHIVEDAYASYDQDIVYLQDIQSIGVVRVADYVEGWLIVEFVRGRFALHQTHVYLVDVDALHGEMTELMAGEIADLHDKLDDEYAQVKVLKEVATAAKDWLRDLNRRHALPEGGVKLYCQLHKVLRTRE